MTNRTSKLVFILFAAICAGLRVYLKLYVIDGSSGFYEGGGSLPLIFNLLLALGVAVLLILSLKPRAEAVRVLRYSPGVRLLSLLLGASALVYAGTELLTRIDEQLSMTGDTANLAIGLVFTGVVFALLPAFAGFTFFRVGLGARGDSSAFHISPYLALSPVLWQVALLLTLFMKYTAVRHVSDQLLTILMLVCFAPFLLSNARVLSDVVHDRGIKRLATFGLPFALLAFSVSAGVIASYIVGNPLYISLSLPGAIFFLIAGIYAVVICFSDKEVQEVRVTHDGN